MVTYFNAKELKNLTALFYIKKITKIKTEISSVMSISINCPQRVSKIDRYSLQRSQRETIF
jgi:hypothetical protein